MSNLYDTIKEYKNFIDKVKCGDDVSCYIKDMPTDLCTEYVIYDLMYAAHETIKNLSNIEKIIKEYNNG